MPPRLTALLGLERRRRPSTTVDAHESVARRAGVSSLEMERHLRQQRAQADRSLKALRAGREFPGSTGDLARMWALLDRSWELRSDDPQEMAFLSWCAVLAAKALDRGFYGRKRACDFAARAEADFGNACRVANRFEDAERALWRARQLFEQGTRDPLLEIRILDFEASMLGSLRQWVRATQKLLMMLRFYEERKDRHLIGRTLVNLGLYAGYEGNYELAVQRLEQSLELIDVKRDPFVACCAAHNLIFFLMESDRIAEAKKFRFIHSRHLLHGEGRVARIKFRVLEGRIAAGEGRHGKAEVVYREVIDGYEQAGLPVNAGIERLSLAISFLHQGKAQEAEATVNEAAEIFSMHHFEREALQAVILLRDSFRMQNATLPMMLEVAEFVRRLVHDPSLRFEARAWEGGEP